MSVCRGEVLLSQPPDCAYVSKCWPTLGLVVMVSSPPVTIAGLFTSPPLTSASSQLLSLLLPRLFLHAEQK